MSAAFTPSSGRRVLALLTLLGGCTEAVFADPDMGTSADAAVDGGAPEAVHVATKALWSPTGELSIARPDSAEGDLLVLFLSRTDDPLPLHLEGWETRASCLTSSNTQLACFTVEDCTMRDGDYCLAFDAPGSGEDLATVVFTRTVGPAEPPSYGWSLRGTQPSWAVLSSVRGANNDAPIRDSAVRSFDAVPASVFPSANAEAGDLLLLFQAFDDPAAEGDFLAPAGMSALAYVVGTDETGYLFGESMTTSGPTGERETLGTGGPDAKDLMLTVVIAAD